MEPMSIIKDWIIPIGSILISCWFAASAKKDSEKASAILEQISKAVDGWQSKIMESTTGILDTIPQVIEGRAALIKVETAKNMADAINVAMQDSIKNPQPGAAGHTQTENLKELSTQLKTILDSMTSQPRSKQNQ